jgi:hypothetical protein
MSSAMPSLEITSNNVTLPPTHIRPPFISSRREQIKAAMTYLTSPELADFQVQFIVETQMLLKPFLKGREKMHLL